MLFGLFGLFWSVLGVPFLEAQAWFVYASPLLMYPVYSLGYNFLVGVLFSIPGSYFIHREVNVGGILRSILAAAFAFNAVDLIAPPLFLAPNGSIALPLGTPGLEGTAVDAFFWAIWRLFTPNPVFLGIGLWYFEVYVVTPILLVVAAALFLKPREFLRLMHVA